MYDMYALGGPETALPALSFKPYGEMGFARQTGVKAIATGQTANPI